MGPPVAFVKNVLCFLLSAGIMAGYRPRIGLEDSVLVAGPLQFNGYIQDLISLWAIFTLIDSVMPAEQPGFGWHAEGDCF